MKITFTPPKMKTACTSLTRNGENCKNFTSSKDHRFCFVHSRNTVTFVVNKPQLPNPDRVRFWVVTTDDEGPKGKVVLGVFSSFTKGIDEINTFCGEEGFRKPFNMKDWADSPPLLGKVAFLVSSVSSVLQKDASYKVRYMTVSIDVVTVDERKK